jgi:hypothetical protein
MLLDDCDMVLEFTTSVARRNCICGAHLLPIATQTNFVVTSN